MSFSVIILFLLGLALVVVGSDYLVDGASAIARRSGLSEFVIGLTIVGIGTSTPEMVVSFLNAIRGNADMAVGNIVGSNIFNTYLILGLTAVILPLDITRSNIRRDIPINIGVSVLLIVLGLKASIFGIGSDGLSRIDGAIFLSLFALYMYFCFKNGKEEVETEVEDSDNVMTKDAAVSWLLVICGLAGLVWGGRMFVDNAVAIAHHFGWSDKFIGVTILAGGTSMPELATCVVAALKKKGQLALGNIIGSNISNILLILGGSALINPLHFQGINSVDLGFMALAAFFLLASYFSFDKKTLDRTEGVVMLLCECVYMYLLIRVL